MAGTGIGVQPSYDGGAPGDLTLRGSVIEDNEFIGLAVSGSRAVVDDSIVRGSKPRTSVGPQAGAAVEVYVSPLPKDRPADVTLRFSVLERVSGIALIDWSSSALLEGVVVHEPEPVVGPTAIGSGVVIGTTPALGIERATGRIDGCRIEGMRSFGVLAADADVTIAHTLVAGTTTAPDGTFGDSVEELSEKQQGDLELSDSGCEGSRDACKVLTSGLQAPVSHAPEP